MTPASPAVPAQRSYRWVRYLAGGAGVLLLVVAALGAYEWHRMHTRPPVTDAFPVKFTEPAPGPKAPSTAGLGFEVGRTHLAEAQARLNSLGINCRDTSPRALVELSRQNKRFEIQAAEEKKAHGETVAAVTGASMLFHRSKMESNPQVRLSCDEVDASKLDARTTRQPYAARILLIWDSAELPLRYASASQALPTFAEAEAAFQSAEKAVETRLGHPGEGKDLTELTSKGFPTFAQTKKAWKYPDYSAAVKAQNLGGRGIQVEEVYEVPWPIRSDAPSLPPTPGSSSPPVDVPTDAGT
jgi:hypothetical protein